MLRIITVCGLGVGSSLIMKMTVMEALKRLDIPCSVEHWDMGTVSGKPCDLIVTSEEFRKNFSDRDNVVYVTNFVDVNEMESKLEEFLSSRGMKS